jgi:hypothetical protein
MREMNISIFAAGLTGNKGSAAMLESIIDNFSKEIPNCQFNVFTSDIKEDRECNKYKNVQLRSGTPAALVLK